MKKVFIVSLFILSSCAIQNIPTQGAIKELAHDEIYKTSTLSSSKNTISNSRYLTQTLKVEEEMLKSQRSSLSLREQTLNNFEKLGGDSIAFIQAMCFFDKFGKSKFKKKDKGKYVGSIKIRNKKYIVIQDLIKSSSNKRFFLLSMQTSLVEVFYSAHGMGTENGSNNNYLLAKNFSNKEGSNLSPRGFMISGERSPSDFAWEWHMKLDGVQEKLNDNNRDRAIVFHKGVSSDGRRRTVHDGLASSDEAAPSLFVQNENGVELPYIGQGMTWGCTAVAKEKVEYIYNKTKGGALFYNYTPAEKVAGASYCGGDNVMLD